jgi:hypothetical protein
MKTILLVLSLLLASVCHSATYYVANDGNDSKAGTSIPNRWATIAKVNGSSFSADDQILFNRGDIWKEYLLPPSSGAADHHIVYGAYGTGDRPIINGSDLMTGFVVHSGNIWKKTGVTYEPNAVYFDNIAGQNAGAIVDVDSVRDWYWASDVLYIYSASDPATLYTAPGVEANARNYAIKIEDVGFNTVQNLHLTKAKYDGIKIYDSSNRHHIIEGVLADYNYKANILVMTGTVYISDSEASYSVSEHGIYLAEETIDSAVEHCHLHHNLYQGIQINPQDAGDERTSGMIVRYNNIHDNGQTGIGVHATSDSEFYGNVIYNNLRNGLCFYDHDDGIGYGCHYNLVYNNTVVVPVTSDSYASGLCARNHSYSNTFRNNLVYVVDPTAPNFYIDNNSTTDTSANYDLLYRASGTHYGYVDSVWKTWGEWQGLGYDTDGLITKPLFQANPPTEVSGYQLIAFSPGVNGGVTLGGAYSTDYAGKTRGWGTGFDIGAYEYITNSVECCSCP